MSADNHSTAPPDPVPPSAPSGGYAELHCKTNFSFLQGASHADELAVRASELGYGALAVTDRNTLSGVVRAHVAAKAAGLKLLIGAEITPEDAARILLFAPDLKAYRRLSTLITVGRRAAEKGESLLRLQDIAGHAEGLLAAVVLPLQATEEWAGRHDGGLSIYREAFGDRCHLTIALHHGADDARRLDAARRLAHGNSLPLLASNDVHYHVPERRLLHDVLTAIRHGTTVADLGRLRFPNGERYLKAPAQMAELFRAEPEAIRRAVDLAARCTFSLDELRYEYPEELCPPGMTPFRHLTDLTWAGARERYPHGLPAKVQALLEREFSLIEELRYEAFFLTVWDLVRFARGRGILCQGRGSAANSAVCYCLGITSVDPDRSDVLFERFISRERNEAPDIDIDFEHERREEVIQYIYEKYGRDRAGIVAEVITYRPRSAVRDVGKALGLSLDCVDRMAKSFDPYADSADLDSRARRAGLDPDTPRVAQFTRLAEELLGFPRHLSQHVGGFVITGGPLYELVPIENAAMADRTVIEWDKDDLDALGILKVDCLSLGMLTAIRKCFDLIGAHYGREITLAGVPAEDSAVYDMICRADTVGVFQIESRAQMSMLPRLLPRCFYDLVIEVAIVRPGPIQGKMVHPYLRRRSGIDPVTYPDKTVEEVLSKTLGVPLFQEQVMRLAMVSAGFTPGEADELRRAMGAWRKTGLIEKYRIKVRDGMLARGLPPEFADQLFEQIRGFGSYGFPEAHAASFALLVYVSAWLKCHYPVAFTAAVLNSLPMGFYAPAQLVRDLREHDATVLPVDVHHSDWDCTLEAAGTDGGLALRLGFRLISGFSRATLPALLEARGQRPFANIRDFARRSQMSRPTLARLAAADAFGSLGLSRREALWHVLSLGNEPPLFASLEEEEAVPACLAEMPLERQVVADYDSIGLSLKAHPIGLVRPILAAHKLLRAADLRETPDKSPVRVAGLVIVRQMPSTAKGTIFMTLEDETGVVNLVLWPRLWERYRDEVYGTVALIAEGKMERAGNVINVIVNKLQDLSHYLRGLGSQSRDFH